MFTRSITLSAATLGFWLGGANPAQAAPPLRGYNADPTQTSISGVSSGGDMAVQFHVAHSSLVRGVGVIAASPYDCAQNSPTMATQNCLTPGPATPLPPTARLVSITNSLAASGAIDDPARLRATRVWLFSGRKDNRVYPVVMDALKDYYRTYIDDNNIGYKNDLDAGHAMITEDYGNKFCANSESPYINDCDYDGAGTILSWIYGSETPLKPHSNQLTGTFIEFDQNPFLPNGNAYSHSMGDSGYAYIPKACESTACRVHVALHGCRQSVGYVGDAFYRHAGYNRWADSNGIIVLYPQTIPRDGWGWPGWRFWTANYVVNPLGCWDWWGYDSSDYHTKNGPQIKAIKGMLDRLAEQR